MENNNVELKVTRPDPREHLRNQLGMGTQPVRVVAVGPNTGLNPERRISEYERLKGIDPFPFIDAEGDSLYNDGYWH